MSLTLIAVEVFGQEFTVAMAKDRNVRTKNEGRSSQNSCNSCACRETRSKVTTYLTKKAIFTNFRAVLF